jgi:hypothetical protein
MSSGMSNEYSGRLDQENMYLKLFAWNLLR